MSFTFLLDICLLAPRLRQRTAHALTLMRNTHPLIHMIFVQHNHSLCQTTLLPVYPFIDQEYYRTSVEVSSVMVERKRVLLIRQIQRSHTTVHLTLRDAES